MRKLRYIGNKSGMIDYSNQFAQLTSVTPIIPKVLLYGVNYTTSLQGRVNIVNLS